MLGRTEMGGRQHLASRFSRLMVGTMTSRYQLGSDVGAGIPSV